jgi:iron complex outermembrane receptor protein
MLTKKFGRSALAIAVASALASVIAPGKALAQEGAGALLDEIVVTARRREESLQQVPLAITAFTGEQLEAAGIETISNMNAVAPNLSVQGGSGRGIESQASFRVRGMPGVAVYVDGIDQSSNTGLFTMGVLEVDRIEVLRGPQGTLFGNSSLGGAIQYVSRRPVDEFGGRVQARTGSYNRRDIQASIDVPLTDNFLTKFTFSDQSRDGFMTSVDNGRKYGDVNDQFYRADLLFTPTDALTLRYSYDLSEQDRQGGARATWEIGPKRIFVVGGQQVNSNAVAQAYENAFGILFDDQNVVSGYPGGVVGEYETRVSHETRGLYLQLARHTFDVSYDINDDFQFRAIVGERETERRLMVDFDSDSRVSFADRQDNDVSEESSLELQLFGAHGDNEQFNWVFGAFSQEVDSRQRFPTLEAETLNCDLWSGTNRTLFGVGIEDEIGCFNARMRALNVQNQFTAQTGMTHADLVAMWNQVVALDPNYLGVTPRTITGTVGPNGDVLNFDSTETSAIYADFSWSVTDKLTLAAGIRSQEDKNLGQRRVRGLDITEGFPWDNIEHTLKDPFAYNRISSQVAPSEFKDTTARFSVQYQWNDGLMTYLTLANGYAPGGRSTTPTTILNVVNGTAVGGFLRDVYNAGLSDLPSELVRGEQTVDSYELGVKADWLDGRLRTNMTYFTTDWRNMTGSTYVATTYWDIDGDGFADENGLIPCVSRCTDDGQYEILWFPNLLTSAVNKAEASGFEAEITYLGGDNFQLGSNIGLLDSKFVDLGDAALGTVPAYKAGDKFAGAPDMTASVWGQYDWTVGDGARLSARLDYTWTDDYTTFAGGPLQRTQKAFGLVNARVTYDPGQNWSLTVAGTNLTDEYYSLAYFYTQSQQLWQGSVGRPREVYLGLNFTFD